MDEMEDTPEALAAIVRGLVDHPDEVEISASERGSTTTLSLRVAPEDVGQVIGRQGRTARSLRALLEARSLEDDQSYALEIRRS